MRFTVWAKRLFIILLTTFAFLTGAMAEEIDDLWDAVSLDEDDIGGEIELAFSGSVDLTRTIREINLSSRLDPNNAFSQLSPADNSLELRAEMSDFLDDGERLRWKLSAYAMKLYGAGSSTISLNEVVRLDTLYLDWALNDWFLSLGKRRINWGVALAFNPVNVVVTPRDPLARSLETEGLPMFLANYSNELISMDMVYTGDFDSEWQSEHQRWGGRLAWIFSDFDMGMYYFGGETASGNQRYPRMLGASFSSNFMNSATLYIEVASFSSNDRRYYQSDGTFMTPGNPHVKAALGSNITLSGTSSLLIEAYFNEAGYTDDQRENYFNALKSAYGPPMSPAFTTVVSDYEFAEMNQIYALISYRQTDIRDQFDIAAQTLLASDLSTIMTLEGAYRFSDFYTVALSLKNYQGSAISEFGNITTYSSVGVTLNASF